MNKLPLWQNKYIDLLSKEKLHHAYLFFGREGLGKQELLSAIGQGILCDESKLYACRKCKNCKLVLTQNHPDFHTQKSSKRTPKLTQNQLKTLPKRMPETMA